MTRFLFEKWEDLYIRVSLHLSALLKPIKVKGTGEKYENT